MNQAEHYPIQKLCIAVHVARSAYYKWLHRTPSHSQQVNEQLVEWIRQHYEKRNGILGYRQMTIVINREHDVHYNKKRIYRLMQILHLKSVTRIKKKTYISSSPQITAENILKRDFHADNRVSIQTFRNIKRRTCRSIQSGIGNTDIIRARIRHVVKRNDVNTLS